MGSEDCKSLFFLFSLLDQAFMESQRNQTAQTYEQEGRALSHTRKERARICQNISAAASSVTVRLLATSLTSFHLSYSSVLRRRPVLGTNTVEPYFFQLDDAAMYYIYRI